MFNKNVKRIEASLVTTICIILLLSVNVQASVGGNSHSSEPPAVDTLLWPSINFTIFLSMIVYFYIKFARPILRDYRIELESSVMRQQNENSMLQSEYEQLQERLSGITEEKQEIVSELEKDGRDLSTVIISAANQQAERSANSGKRRYELEIKKVSSEAKKVLMERVLNKVKSQVLTSFTDEDDAKFIKSSVERDFARIFNRD